MRVRTGAALAGAGAAMAAAAAFAGGSSGGSSPPKPAPLTAHPRGVLVDCSRRSEASFPGAYRDVGNLVVGPLALMGAGERTPASVVREFGGNKFPLLVKAGHTVTVRLPRRVRDVAGLAYGGLGKRPLPQGETKLRHAAHTMTFKACRPGRPTEDYRDYGPSASTADGQSVTFWSGFVVMRRPACVPLEVWVDGEREPRHAVIDMGAGGCGSR